MDQYASDDHLIKMRSLLLIRCLPKISLSSLTFTGSQIADCHLEVIFDVNMHRNLSWNLFTVDGKNVHRQFLSEPGSVRYFSTLPLATVWSNYQTLFFDFFEVCITKMVTITKCSNFLTDQFNSVFPNHVISHFAFWLVNRLTADITMTISM